MIGVIVIIMSVLGVSSDERRKPVEPGHADDDVPGIGVTYFVERVRDPLIDAGCYRDEAWPAPAEQPHKGKEYSLHLLTARIGSRVVGSLRVNEGALFEYTVLRIGD